MTVTLSQLSNLCKAINLATDSPLEPYYPNPMGQGYIAAIGCYHVSSAYGGVCLERIVSDGGGTTNVFGGGYTTKLVLQLQMRAYLQGITLGKTLA